MILPTQGSGFPLVLGTALLSSPAWAADPTIPLCPGLTVVTAVNQQEGDYESIKTVESVGADGVRIKYSAEMKNTDMLSSGPPLKKVMLERTVLNADLQSATRYQQLFLEKSADTIPGTTAIGSSAAVLRALKSQGRSDFGISIGYDGLELSADRSKSPNYYSFLESGTLMRVPGEPNTVSVLVNDVAVDLPVIRAEGDFVSDKVEFLFLDDARNPLTLAFRIGIGAIQPLNDAWLEFCATLAKKGQAPSALPGGGRCDRPKGGDRDVLKVVKIVYRCPQPAVKSPAPESGGGAGAGAGAGGADLDSAGRLEQALATARKVDVYSIYFSFNSDAIREESDPTLKDIAEVLRRHPDWKLAVNGHTDAIGDDRYNLDLSKRRAAAVGAALAARYGVDGSRLSSSGFGKSQPKDTNDTLEGRARNRRVELVRL